MECRSFCRICDKWYIDKDWLYQKYIIEKLSYDDIVKIIGSKSNRPIRNYLKKYGIKSRDMSECGRSRVEKIKLNITDKFLSIFDGLVISDGCIFNHKMGHNTNFKFEQTISKKELVYKVKDVFENTGIGCRIEVRKGGEHIICGKDCVVKDSIYLRTMKHPFFTEQRKRWYNDEGKKIIPRDIKFNELMLAYWMMGDGCLSKVYNRYSITLCTNSFNYNDIEYLVDMFNNKYNIKFRINGYKDEYIMVLNNQYDIYRFCKMIEPYIVDCFKYKVRCLYDDE